MVEAVIINSVVAEHAECSLQALVRVIPTELSGLGAQMSQADSDAIADASGHPVKQVAHALLLHPFCCREALNATCTKTNSQL